jgi:23S rRNA (cytidine1920-2'-O)/16S rRNA (cytidine1409-2'-O)-methyltransferase
VQVRERTDVRDLGVEDLGERPSVVVADLSFISVRSVLPALLGLAAPGADLVWLVKPQFEAGRREASRGRGVITDPEVWRRTLAEVIAAMAGQRATIMGAMVSPLRGADGNVEFPVHATAPGQAAPPQQPTLAHAALVDAAVREATNPSGAGGS